MLPCQDKSKNRSLRGHVLMGNECYTINCRHAFVMGVDNESLAGFVEYQCSVGQGVQVYVRKVLLHWR